MSRLRPYLAVALSGVLWLVMLSQPGVRLPGALRPLSIGLCVAVTGAQLWSLSREPAASYLGPLAVCSNALFGALVILGLKDLVSRGGLLLMLLALAQAILFFLLVVTYTSSAERQREESRGRLNQKTQQLLYLQQVGSAMNTTEEIKSFLDMVLRATSNIIKASRVLLFLPAEGGTLDFEAGHGVDGLEARIPTLLHHPLTERVNRESLTVTFPPIVVPDEPPPAVVSPNQLASVSLERGRSYMMVPLVRKEGAFGVFYVEGKGTDVRACFDDADLEVFRILASQISVALENADLYFQMRSSYRSTIEALAAAIEAKDAYTHGHSSAVTRYAVPVARELGITEPDLQTIEFAAILHDIGKIAVPESVLNKPGKLTREEFEDIKRHPTVGAEIIRPVFFLKAAVEFILHHHERWDGKGYPDGLAGDQIPLGAQVVGIVDTFDAMTSTRSYRKSLGEDEAVREIQRCAGTQFNPVVVQAFMRAYGAGKLVPDSGRPEYVFEPEASRKASEGAKS